MSSGALLNQIFPGRVILRLLEFRPGEPISVWDLTRQMGGTPEVADHRHNTICELVRLEHHGKVEYVGIAGTNPDSTRNSLWQVPPPPPDPEPDPEGSWR